MQRKWAIDLLCSPSSPDAVTRVLVEPGWSPSTGDECVRISVRAVLGDINSETATRSYPDDCLVVSEAPAQASLLAGLLVLGAFALRARRLSAGWSNRGRRQE